MKNGILRLWRDYDGILMGFSDDDDFQWKCIRFMTRCYVTIDREEVYTVSGYFSLPETTIYWGSYHTS